MSENGLLTPELSKRLQAMVGFRSIAVHDYQSVNLVILQRIIENNMSDLKQFAEIMLKS